MKYTVILCLLGTMLFSCGQTKEDKLLGTWEAIAFESKEGQREKVGFAIVLSFEKEGMLSSKVPGIGGDTILQKGRWKLSEDGKLLNLTLKLDDTELNWDHEFLYIDDSILKFRQIDKDKLMVMRRK